MIVRFKTFQSEYDNINVTEAIHLTGYTVAIV